MRRRLGLAACALLVACGEAAPDLPAVPEGGGADGGKTGTEAPTYEQNFVFAGMIGDSIFLVPWLIRTTAGADSVSREARGWLARSGTWDAFYAESWSTPLTRTPARILPYGNLKLLVQEGDVVDGIIFEDGARRLELALGEVHASWGGPRGEAIDLVEGAAFLSDERVEGLILHLARASAGGTPPGGDWALLMSGDSMHLVIAANAEHGGDVEPFYRGWGDLASNPRLWPEIQVDWMATEAFPPARRDVPVSWRLSSADGMIEGELDVVSAEMQAGSGPGPLLPVRALFEVAGEISMPEGDFPVRGILVHERR